MMTSSEKYRMKLIFWSLVWAFALIAAAYIFKNNPIKDGIESALLVGAIACLLWNYEQRPAR
jgi:hypothetical protein